MEDGSFDFKAFKSSIRGQLKLRKIDCAEVDYIAVTQTYWMSYRDFMDLEFVPIAWNHLEEDDIWEHIDMEFRVVLKDGQWLQYIHIWSDDSYSHFRLITPPKKPRAQHPRCV